jgi:hypothetical protein
MNKLLATIFLAMLFEVSGGQAWAGVSMPPMNDGCLLLICKDAGSDVGDTGFFFEADQNGQIEEFTLISQGECFELNIGSSNILRITEGPTPGFVLDSVVCSGFSAPVVITELDNGIEAACNSAGDEGICTFLNVRGVTPTNIPTLSEWGTIATAACLMLVGVFFAVYRKLAAKT